jgi:CRP-like cAMP-binding protein
MLTSEEQSTLRANAPTTEVSAGLLTRQGVPLSHVMIIRSGWAKATTVTYNGQEVMLRLYGPGDVIGVEQVLTGEAPAETVTVKDDVVYASALLVRRFTDFMAHAPNASRALHRVLQQRVQEADRFRSLSASATGLERVSGLLVELCRDDYQPQVLKTGELVIPPVRLSQQDLASWIGDSRKTVVRALTDLRDLGIIHTFTQAAYADDTRGRTTQLCRHILVSDLDRLRACATPTGMRSRAG